MSEIEIVERPCKQARGPKKSPETVAFLQTAKTGKAIRVAMNGVTWNAWRNRFYNAASRASLSAHTSRDGDYIIAWATERAEE